MKFAHMEKTSLLDYPGRVSTVLFTVGCNFRCPFCYNRKLVIPDEYPEANTLLDEEYVLRVLERRKKYIDAVAITGGEPLMHEDIIIFLSELRKREFSIKIDTNGSFPERLGQIIDKGLVDYVAMDIKNSPERYNESCGINVNIDDIKRSISILKEKSKQGKIDYEFKTTLVPGLHTIEDLKNMHELIGDDCKRLFLQPFRNDVPLINPEYNKKNSLNDAELEAFHEAAKGLCKEVSVRRYF